MGAMTRKAFEQVVEEALAGLPAEFRERLENVVVQVEPRPTARQRESVGLGPNDDLFGLYEGVPLTERAPDFAGMPDRVSIFQEPIESACANRAEMIQEIQDTVVHEIGHFFGLEEDELEATESEYDDEGAEEE